MFESKYQRCLNFGESFTLKEIVGCRYSLFRSQGLTFLGQLISEDCEGNKNGLFGEYSQINW